MSVEVGWKDKGATISSLNAVKEFPALTNDDIDAAIADGKLDTRAGSFMGKSYVKLLRHQVQKLARQVEKKQNKTGDSSDDDVEEEEKEEEVERREPTWSDKGATISDKNAIKEFPALTMESIESALESGELESRPGNFMGKPYRKLLVHRVKRLAEKLDPKAESSERSEESDDDDDDDEERRPEAKKSKMSDGDRKRRLADIESQLGNIEEKKRKLLEEKKSLEKGGE